MEEEKKPTSEKQLKAVAHARESKRQAKQYNTEFADFAERLAATGANESDIAYLVGTSISNLKKWKKEFPDFKKALNRGKQLTRAYLIARGIKYAAGFDYIEKTTKYAVDEKGKRTGTVQVTETPKRQPVNEKLLVFLVTNIDRQLGGSDWLSKQIIESKLDKTVNVRITGKIITDQIDRIAGRLAKQIEDVEITDAEFIEPKQLETGEE